MGPLVDLVEAVRSGWLELWYQPKIDTRAMVMLGRCANDAVKQSMCCRILDLASGYGARTVAEGVETWADFLAVRELGFDLVQGFLFAKPTTAQQFGQTGWIATRHCLRSARSLSVTELPFFTSRPLM